MSFLEAVGTKVLAGTILEIIKRTGFKKLTKKKETQLSGKVDAAISEILNDIDCSGLDAFLKLSSTNTYFYNYLRLVPYKEYSEFYSMSFIRPSEFADILAAESMEFMKRNQYKKPTKIITRSFFMNLLDILEEELVESLPDELTALPFLLIKNIEQTIRAFHESSAGSKIETPIQDKVIKHYLLRLQDVFSKNHVPGVNVLSYSQYYIPPKFIFYNEENKTSDFRGEFLSFLEESKPKEIDWKDIFKVSNLVSIVGGPGYGKTIFSKYVVINSNKLRINNSENYIPIYCNLKDFIDGKKLYKSFSFVDFLVESIVSYTGSDVSKETINYFLERGECLIFLDALDEVDSLERQKFSNLIIGFFKSTNNNNKVCITTRERSLIPDTPVVLKVENITIRDINNYLNLMVKIKEFRNEDIQDFLHQCWRLIMDGFLTNFLTVALMVKIYKADRKIPENKIELFDKCVDYTAREREREKNVGFDFDKMESIINNNASFEALANLSKRNNKEIYSDIIINELCSLYSSKYRDANDARNAINHFLKYCQERTDLYILGNKENHFKFFHRSFFEFFYAKYLVKNTNGIATVYSELYKFSADSELPELLLAFLKQYNYKRYIKLIDVAIEKAKQLKTVNAYRLAIDFVKQSDEYSHLEKFYILFFSSKDIIMNFNSDFNNLSSVLVSLQVFDNLFKDLIEHYPDQLIASFIQNVTFIDRTIHFKYPNAVVTGLSLLNFEREEVNLFIDTISLERFKQVISKGAIYSYKEGFINTEYDISFIYNLLKEGKLSSEETKPF